MDRRGFFKSLGKKAVNTAVKSADNHVSKRAANWIRPPYALTELDFLIACTRCDDCVKACPHQVIFKLPARLGAQVAGTPALDLTNKACQLCEDWPCVNACEDKALVLPEPDDNESQIPTPKLARVTIDVESCLPYNGPECGACAGSCPVPGALTWDMTRPVVGMTLCTGCGLCRQACIMDPSAIFVESLHQPAPSLNEST